MFDDDDDVGETVSAVGEAGSTGAAVAGATARVVNGSPEAALTPMADATDDLLDTGGAESGVANVVGSIARGGASGMAGSAVQVIGGGVGGVLGASGAIAGLAGASSGVTRGLAAAGAIVGAASTVVGTVMQLAGAAPGATEQLGPKVEYKLRTWNSVTEACDSGRWRVHSIELVEVINETSEAIVIAELPDSEVDPTVLVGANAELRFERDPRFRTFKGVIRQVFHGAISRETTRVRLHITPAFSLGEQRMNTRIWQAQTVPQVLREVLNEILEPFDRDFNLDGLGNDYPEREYCVQYQESDYDFALRLMQEEGINFHFEHDYIPDPDAEDCDSCGNPHRSEHPCQEEHEVLMLCDDNEHFVRMDEADPVPVPIVARSAGGIEGFFDFQRSVQMIPTGVLLDGRWDFTSCTQPAASEHRADSHGREREEYDHETPLTMSNYIGTRYCRHDAERQATRRRRRQVLEEQTFQGLGFVVRMKPGQKFEMTEHPNPEMNGIYLITRVTHQSSPPNGGEATPRYNYHNVFEAIPADVQLVPARNRVKHRIPGIATAIVVGRDDSGTDRHPDTSDIAPVDRHRVNADEHGRIKLWFPWDRYGRRNERSTCWVRVQQPVAGNGWGAMFLPHVGMEVVVSFINGDPDHPIVTGSVYNGNNRPPLDVQNDDNPRSTLRTVRGNELQFDDTAGRERIYVHARYDAESRVTHDRTDHIGHDDHETVVGAQTCTVQRDRSHSVHGAESVTVNGERHLNVRGGLFHTDVTGEHRVTVSDKMLVQATNEICLRIGQSGSMIKMRNDKIEIHAGGGAVIDLDALVKAISNAGARLVLEGTAVLQDATAQGSVQCGNNRTVTLAVRGGGSVRADASSSTLASPDGRATSTVANGLGAVTAPVIELNGSGSICKLESGKASIRGTEALLQGGSGASSVKCSQASTDVAGPIINLNS